MTYTPGPWKVHYHSHIDKEQWLSILNGAFDVTHNGAGNPAVVACSKYSAMTDEENLANAFLMAAAPELKEYGYALAMKVLQSDLYQKDPDVRDDVDNFLLVNSQSEGR